MRQAGPGTPGAHDTAAPHWEYIGAITPGWKYTSVRVCYVCVAVVVIVILSNVLKILYLWRPRRICDLFVWVFFLVFICNSYQNNADHGPWNRILYFGESAF